MEIEVKVIPNAKNFAIRREGKILKVWIPEKAEKGKANAYLIKELRKIFQAEIRIIKGYKGRRKILAVMGDEEKIRRTFEKL